MRSKHILAYLPLPAYAKLFWERITFSRLTIIYLSFSFLHFLIQLALQIRAFTTNVAAFNAGTLLVQQGHQLMQDQLPFYVNSTLSICKWVPSNLSLKDGNCTVIWPENNVVSGQDNLPPVSANYASEPTSIVSLEPASTDSSFSFAIPSQTISSILSTSVLPAASAATGSALPVTLSPTSLGLKVTSTPILVTPTVTTTIVAATRSGGASTTTVFTVVVAPTSTTRSPPVSTTITGPVPTGINNSGNPVASPASGRNPGAGEDDEDEDEDDIFGSILNNGDDSNEDDRNLRTFFPRVDTTDEAATQDFGIPPVCLQALNYPLSILGNTKREDIVFISFQFWVLGMSVVALLNESIPHIFASLLTHIMATAWGAFQLIHTANFRKEFNTLITNGACRGVSAQLPIALNYWQTRKAAEVSSLTLNVLALVVSGLLSWKLFKLFGWQTFKRVGASLVINRVYKLVLTLSIAIQLSLFFMAVTVSLWLDRLVKIGQLADFRDVYVATSVITLTLLVPWLMVGWFGVRRELKVVMLVFLGFCLVYLGGWSVLFVSTTFRWTFITWRFFSIMATASVLLTVTCLILGILCFMNFGKGLTRYLSAEDDLPGDFGIVTPDYGYGDEKVEFPSTEKPTPTFNAAYGNQASGGDRMFISNGPRFFNQASQPGMPVAFPQQVLTRAPSDGSSYSHSSEKSASSFESYYHYSHSRNDSKRWIIE